jgi:hypothetical protein
VSTERHQPAPPALEREVDAALGLTSYRLRLPAHLAVELEQRAKEQGIPVGAALREAVRVYLAAGG